MLPLIGTYVSQDVRHGSQALDRVHRAVVRLRDDLQHLPYVVRIPWRRKGIHFAEGTLLQDAADRESGDLCKAARREAVVARREVGRHPGAEVVPDDGVDLLLQVAALHGPRPPRVDDVVQRLRHVLGLEDHRANPQRQPHARRLVCDEAVQSSLQHSEQLIVQRLDGPVRIAHLGSHRVEYPEHGRRVCAEGVDGLHQHRRGPHLVWHEGVGEDEHGRGGRELLGREAEGAVLQVEGRPERREGGRRRELRGAAYQVDPTRGGALLEVERL
mmetsp:Transcript_90094/g.263412  ORF Transcript_90094/g.263412 Transcript_90094/m.263412 type:complete len:272 (+) Transcript_90094:855-1670(+)